MHPLKIAAIAAAASVTTYLVVPQRGAPPLSPTTMQAAPLPKPELELREIEGVRFDVQPHAESRGARNLFDYDEPVPAPPVVLSAAKDPPIALPAGEPSPVFAHDDNREVLPQFDYRYLGKFGHDHDPIAAFERDGEIVTARRGDRVGNTFVVRSVGLESATVGLYGRDVTQTIPLTGSR